MGKETKIIHRSNYLIYIDDVRVDQFVSSWQTNNGLSANETRASITFFRSPEMDEWKAYLSKVKIFAENPFTRKFTMIFEGDIISRSWHENKTHMGLVTFHCSGFHHWLDIQIPMAISNTDEMNPLQRFIYEAQNINIEEVRSLITSDSEILMKDNNIRGIINQLFEKLTAGYYEAAEENTNFAFSRIKERFIVMSDVKEEFRESGFLDLFTFHKATFIDSFMAFFMEVVEQMMMEFYQDRDGTFKVKFPAWGEDVLMSQVIDSSIIEKITGTNNWGAEPTRVLAIGSASQLQKAMYDIGGTTKGLIHDLSIPVGLYIGNPRKADDEEYHSVNLKLTYGGGDGGGAGGQMGSVGGFNGVVEGFAPDEIVNHPNTISTPTWFDYLGSQRVTGPFQQRSKGFHWGTDYGTQRNPVYSVGTKGKVVAKQSKDQGKTMGNNITIGQEIDGQYYEFKYMHLDTLPKLEVGQIVYPGQYIANSGNTGSGYSMSTGSYMAPHLHLEIWKDKWYKKPYKEYAQNPEQFLKRYREKFKDEPKVKPGEGVSSGGGSSGGGSSGGGDASISNVDTSGRSSNEFVDYKSHPMWKPSKSRIADPESKYYDSNFTLNYGTTAEMLNQKLKGKGVLEGKGQLFYNSGMRIGVDPAFIAAVALHESGNGTSNAARNRNNPFGIMDPSSGWSRIKNFSSIEEAATQGWYKMVMKKFLDKNIVTPRLLQPYYAPFPASNDPDGLNKFWVGKVTQRWLELRGDNPNPGVLSGGGIGSGGSANAGSGSNGFGLVAYPTKFKQMTDTMNAGRLEYLHNTRVEKPLNYHNNLTSTIPLHGRHLQGVVDSYKGKVAPALLVSIANTTSRWSKKYKTSRSVGVMANNKKLLDKNEPKQEAYILESPYYSIAKAVKDIQYAQSFYFGGKIVPTLIYYFHENPAKFVMEYREAGKDVMKIIKKNGSGVRNMQAVIDDLLKGQATYIKGEFHRDMTGKVFEVDGKAMQLNEDGSYSEYNKVVDEYMAEEAEEVEEFIPRLSEEEKMYKINLVQVEQELIRTDSPVLSQGTDAETLDGEVGEGDGEGDEGGGEENAVSVDSVDKEVDSDAKPPQPKAPEDNVGPIPIHEPVRSITNRDLVRKAQSLMKDDAPSDYSRMTKSGPIKSSIMEGLNSNPFEGKLVLADMVDKVNKDKKPPAVEELPSPDKGAGNEKDNNTGDDEVANENLEEVAELETAGDEFAEEINELIYQFARYNMQLHRAMAHNINVSLTLCLPQLRVGLNTWLEPTRTDLMFYTTGVSHSGSFNAGCKTQVTGAFIRDVETYKDVPESIFLGDKLASTATFGNPVSPDQMKNIRNELRAMHAKGLAAEAHKMTTLGKLYGSQDSDDKYSSKWNSEKTLDEIESLIKKEYAEAPEIIKEKKNETAEVISASVDVFIEKLHSNFLKKDKK